MPSYEGQISEEGILQLVAEIKSMSPHSKEPSPGAASPSEEKSTEE
jgi:hypothetical protein